MSKILFFALIIYFVAQINCQNPSILIKDDVFDNARALVDKAANVTEQSISDAIGNLIGTANDVISFIVSLEQSGIKEIEPKFLNLLLRLNNLKDKAINAGVDATVCFLDQEDGLLAMPVDFVSRINNCNLKAVKDIMDTVKQGIDSIRDVVNIIDKLLKSLNTCGVNPICLMKVAGEATIDTVELPVQVTQRLGKAIAILATFKISAAACISAEIVQVPIDGANLLVNVGQCVDEKIIRP